MLREIISNEWFTVLLIISIGLIAITKLTFNSRFNDFLSLVGNSKYLKVYSRDQKFIDLFDGLLFLNLIISTTLFVLLSIGHLSESLDITINLFLKIALSLGLIILIKILTERLLGSLFEIDELIDPYLFQKISYKNFLGIILIPINILLLYTVKPSVTIVYIVLFLLIAINLIGVITTLRSNQKLLLNNFFYFILYLCALEISPYLILYKVIKGV